MKSPLRAIIDSRYRNLRQLDASIDDTIPTGPLVHWLAGKAVALVRGVVRLRSRVFLSPRVRLRGKYLLRLGRGCSLATGVVVDAISRDGVTLGDSVTVDEGAILRASGVYRNLGTGIVIGDRTAVGVRNFLHGGGGITIGADCLLGPDVRIFSENHISSDVDVPIRDQGEVRAPVVIEDDVWIGAGTVVVAGAHIGHGAIIGAGSVVRGTVEPRSIYAGVPAKLVRRR